MAVILLNSNFAQLSAAEEKKQVDWLKQSLEEFDADPTIQFVITCCHHSPFTNHHSPLHRIHKCLFHLAENQEAQKKHYGDETGAV